MEIFKLKSVRLHFLVDRKIEGSSGDSTPLEKQEPMPDLMRGASDEAKQYRQTTRF